MALPRQSTQKGERGGGGDGLGEMIPVATGVSPVAGRARTPVRNSEVSVFSFLAQDRQAWPAGRGFCLRIEGYVGYIKHAYGSGEGDVLG